MATEECEIHIAGITAKLDAIHEDVRDLKDKVGIQNGRLGKLETKCAAHDSISVSRTRTEMASDTRMGSMDERIKDLEGFRERATGAGKASLGILSQLLTILALVLACWQYIESRPAHQATPQHLGAK
jgi:hypothetical protein